jgi:hypothetical protein
LSYVVATSRSSSVRLARFGDIVCRKRDLDARRQQADSPQRRLRVSEGRSDRGMSRVDASTRQVDERDSRLWFLSEPASFLERLLGSVEVAEATADLADLVEAPARGRLHRERHQLIEPRARLAFGVGKRASQSHDLGAVHAADAGKSRHRLALTPARRGLGPLAGAAIVCDRPADADRDAVNASCGERRQLAGNRGDGGLVREREALFDLRLHHEAPTLKDESERLEVTVAEPSADVECTPRALHGLVERSATEQHHAARELELEVPVLDAFGLVLEEPARTADPSVPQGRIASFQVLVGQPQGDARGSSRVPLR